MNMNFNVYGWLVPVCVFLIIYGVGSLSVDIAKLVGVM